MKTLTELMDNIKALQKGLDEVYGDIAELQEAERSKEDMPDIVDWLNYARQHPLTGHPLTTVNNLEIQEIYIKLLFTVAMCHIYLNHEISPLVYPCQIAASLGDNINGERLFKESLSLDSLTIRKYCEQIKGQGLDAYFLIDSLIITGKYEQDNHEKMDYIASLAAIMEVSPEKFADILTLAKAYVEEPEEFVGRLMEVYTPESLFYLKSCTSFKVIETPICFVAHSETMRECDEAICQFLPISNKVSALFSNISFKNTAENKLTFSSMKQLEFNDCEFKDFDHTVINADSIDEISFENTNFNNIIINNFVEEVADGCFTGLTHWRYQPLLAGTYKTEPLDYSKPEEYYKPWYNYDEEGLKKVDLVEVKKYLHAVYPRGTNIFNAESYCHKYYNWKVFELTGGIIGEVHLVNKIGFNNVSARNCFVSHYIQYYDGGLTSKQKMSRGIPDYTENSLFKGISRNQIEEKNCAWENCCKLV